MRGEAKIPTTNSKHTEAQAPSSRPKEEVSRGLDAANVPNHIFEKQKSTHFFNEELGKRCENPQRNELNDGRSTGGVNFPFLLLSLHIVKLLAQGGCSIFHGPGNGRGLDAANVPNNLVEFFIFSIFFQ